MTWAMRRAAWYVLAGGLGAGLARGQPAAPAGDDVAVQARAVIDKALAAYRDARSYSDSFQSKFEAIAKDKTGADAGHVENYEGTTVFARPNRLAIVTPDAAIQSDGKKLWLSLKKYRQYQEADASPVLDIAAICDGFPFAGPPHPIVHVLSHPDQNFAQLFPAVNGLTAVSRESREGQSTMRVDGTFDGKSTPLSLESDKVPFSAWFDEKTGLLREIRIDILTDYRKIFEIPAVPRTAEALQELPEGMPATVEKAEIGLKVVDAKTNVEPPGTAFVYQVPARTKRVQEFSPPDPEELLGTPAPAIGGKDLKGEALSLEKLRGRVVVLDFWATWCAPCVQAMPAIQKLHEKYATQTVTIIGINQDPPRQDDKVKKFVGDKKLTFAQYLDPEGKLGDEYNVNGIPCTFLIGKDGTIQAVHMGYTPNADQELSEQIDKLLKGEQLAKRAMESEAKGTPGAATEESGEDK